MEVNRAARSSRVREHFRSNVVGYVAIFLFAVAGTASALPGRNTVDSGDIKNKQVKRADIAPNAVNGSRVANGAIGGADVNEGSLGQVPRAASAAALGGTPAAEVVRTDPAIGPHVTPFFTEGSLDVSDTASTFNLGPLTLEIDGGAINLCNRSTSNTHLSYSPEFGVGSHTALSPNVCFFTGAGPDVITITAENSNATVYATLVDTRGDGVYRIWAFS
jgi:hypothetical protein